MNVQADEAVDRYMASSREYAELYRGLREAIKKANAEFMPLISQAISKKRAALQAIPIGTVEAEFPSLTGRFARVLPSEWESIRASKRTGLSALPIVLLTRPGGDSKDYQVGQRIGAGGKLVYHTWRTIETKEILELIPVDSPELKPYKRWAAKQALLGKRGV